MSKRQYGTGQLYIEGANYYGRWRSLSGAKRNRKVGLVRKTGTREGLTKVLAEKKFQEMMGEADSGPTPATRTRLPEAGAALVRRLKPDRKRSYVETVESIIRVHLETAAEFMKDLDRIDEDDIER